LRRGGGVRTGAGSGEPLPGFPMPSHRVLKVQQYVPAELKTNEVRAPPKQPLRREVRLRHALSDLPKVAHDESDEAQPYSGKPDSEFARYCRQPPPRGHGVKHEPKIVYDHTPQVRRPLRAVWRPF
jgi:hypothetical protein